MGDLLWQMGKLSEAIDEYYKAIEIKPDFHVSAGKIAYIYAMQEDYKKAEKWFGKANDIAPSSGTKAVWYWVNAWIFNWLGDLHQANESLKASRELALKQDNENTISGANWLKAFMERDLGRFDSAEANFQKALRIFLKLTDDISNDSAAYFLFTASVRLAEGKPDKVQLCLDNVKRLMPKIKPGNLDFIRYWYECTHAEMLFIQKDFHGLLETGKRTNLPALPQFEYPQVLIYNIPSRHDFVARAYAELGMTTDAISEYERLVTFDPSGSDRRLIHPIFHYNLGKLYEETGQADKAIAQYRKFLEIWHNADPTYPEPADSKKRLEHLLRQ